MPLTLAVAAGSYYLIERPALAARRMLGSRTAGGRGRTPATGGGAGSGATGRA